ncbi:alpha/beta fold hydrolase [Oerskovia jenensis]|uniref:alpha/beta fold hydrolase n=1 Tax=Oerskovia jenensis TaxID=162169 RepID=UPI0036D8520D
MDQMTAPVETRPPSRRRGRRRLRRVFLASVAVVAVAVVGVKVVDVVMTYRERAAHPAPGELVEVDGHQMHVQRTGGGQTTVVLLPGLGTASPVGDFEPLTRHLSTWATVVVVEPFGYGWSEATAGSMRPAQVARDVHGALTAVGVEGPVVLMPHSVGALHVQAFADQYPGQVAAVVGIDPTMPRTEDFAPALEDGVDPYASPLPWFVEPLARGGWLRVLQGIMGSDPNLVTGGRAEHGYTQESLDRQSMITNWSGVSRNVMAQAQGLADAIADTRDLRFAPDVPVLTFVAHGGDGLPAWQEQVVADYGAGSSCADSVSVDAEHYVHHTHAATLSRHTEEFLARCGVGKESGLG